MRYTLKPYQEIAVYDEADGLLSNTLRFLKSTKHQRLFILKSIMGSGKTIIASEFIEALLESDDTARKEKEICVIWLSKGNAGLHMQSSEKLQKSITAKDIHIYGIRDSADFNAERFYDKDVYVINWEKINNMKDGELVNNLFVESENKNLRQAIKNSKGMEYIFIIDEFHMNYNTESYKKIMEIFDPHVIIGMSATPTDAQMSAADARYCIPVEDVVKEGMVKKGVCFNTVRDYTDGEIAEYNTIDEFFLKLALRQREQLEKKYREIGSDAIPLLLIQFNDDKNNADIIKVKEMLEKAGEKDFAVWISETDNRKDKLRSSDEVIKTLNENKVKVLLFKQAVATGWDCPRAQVLLRYRKVVTKKDADAISSFDIQTLGRIFRMPEPEKFADKGYKHYEEDELNYGYVYVPNNSYELEKGFTNAYGKNSEMFRKQVVNVEFEVPKTGVDIKEKENKAEKRPEIQGPPKPPMHENTKSEPYILHENTECEQETFFDDPLAGAMNPPVDEEEKPKERTKSEKYSAEYSKAILDAEEVLSQMNVSATNVPPSADMINQAIKRILEEMRMPEDAQENTKYKITFQGKEAKINDAMFDEHAKTDMQNTGTAFSIDDTPSVLSDKADKLLAEKIDRKRYPKETKKFLKDSIRRFFRKEVAEADRLDERIAGEVSKLILLNENLINGIIQRLDEKILQLDEYRFEEAKFHFPRAYYPPPQQEENSKGIMHFPLPDSASGPEKIFEKLLNANENVLLWYKNADSGKNAFCVQYAQRGNAIKGRVIERRMPTYPDFIVLFKDGAIGIYETKDHDKKDEKDQEKATAISNIINKAYREIPGVKLYGGLIYINQRTEAVQNTDICPELVH